MGVTTLQKNRAEDRADKLHHEIHAPLTGWKARLGLCEANVETVEGALEQQSEAIRTLHRESAERLADTERQLAAAQRVAAEARVRADRLSRITPAGDTVCERVLDVDRQILEELTR